MPDGGSAHDRRDAKDRRLLASGDYWTLLAGYYDAIRDRCLFRLGSRDAGDEVAHVILRRLYEELTRGKRYPVPIRVVVWNVTEWTLRGWPASDGSVRLPDEWDPAGPDPYEEWESDYDLCALFEDLPRREREVCRLRYLQFLEPHQIAAELGMNINAVYQALHRAHEKLREELRD